MGKRCFTTTLLIYFSLVSVAFAQPKVFDFNDELCSYKGYYDGKKYSEKQLRDTYSLFATSHSTDDGGTVEELRSRYDAVIETLTALQTVDNAYFKQLKVDVLTYVKQTYALKIVQKNARLRPADLISAVEKGSDAQHYAEVLNSSEDVLLQEYKELTKSQMKKNGSPENLWNRYLNTMSKANKLDLAFDYVLVYGWWNSANRQIDHVVYDGTQMKNFLALFSKVDTLDCDEP